MDVLLNSQLRKEHETMVSRPCWDSVVAPLGLGIYKAENANITK